MHINVSSNGFSLSRITEKGGKRIGKNNMTELSSGDTERVVYEYLKRNKFPYNF